MNHARSERDRRPDGRAARARRVALVAICLGYFMTILDTTIVNVALPAISRSLGASVAGLQWVVDGYTLVFASFLLTAGALGDRFGSRGMFVVGLGLFTGASALCGLAPSLGALLAFRVAQGLGATLLVPTSLALLRHTSATPHERARATGVWGGIAGIGAASGPVVGGLLIAAFGWRAIFLVNVPIGAGGALLTLRFVAPAPPAPGRGLDLPAQLAGVCALGLLTFACIEGGGYGVGAPLVAGALFASAVAIIAFVVIERRATGPMLPLGLFKAPAFAGGVAVGLLINFGFYGQLFVISLFFQQLRGYSALLAGLALLPESGVVPIASYLSGRATGRSGPRLPMTIGLLTGGLGLIGLVLVGTTVPYLALCPLLIATGFGMSFTMPAMTSAVMEAAPGDRAAVASAALNASRQVGSVLGVALLGALVGHRAGFVPGMHAVGLLAGAAFLGACALTRLAIHRRR